jgi:hypothetical protein
MKKHSTLMKTVGATCVALITGITTHAQFTETMGTTGSSTETIAVHEANNRFSVTSLTYSGTADVRTTTPSTGYPGSSGSFNVLIQAQETFQIESINAAACSADSISFGIFKTTNASTGVDYLVLEYSTNSGSTWTSIPYTALPTGSGTSKWYRRSVAVPAAAHVSTLWLRFRSSLVGTSASNPQFRIDDVAMTCGATVSCAGLTSTVAVTGDNVFCEGSSAQINVTTNVTSPSIQWYNQDGIVAGATSSSITVSNSGTYYAQISNASGCQIESAPSYILAYPTPDFCPVTVEGCTGDIVDACAIINSGDLIISEYVEGSGFNKYLEIYNGTCGPVNMDDYELRAYHNGANVPTYTIELSGALAQNNVYVIADSEAVIWTGTPNLLSDFVQWNGDDALVLYNTATSTVVDIFGSVGHDPGSAWRDTDTNSATYGWRTENKTLVRKSCVYTGITTNPDLAGIGGFPTLVTEWDTLSVDDVSNLGFHDFGAASYTFAVVSGNSTIESATGGNCAQVRVATGTTTLSVSADFCGFNNCSVPVNAITVVDTCRTVEGRMEKSSSIKGAELKTEAFPNPFTDNVTVQFEQENDGVAMIALTTLSGQVVFTQAVNAQAGKQRVELNTADLAAGTYILNIQSDKGLQSVRIVKSK